MKQRVDGSDRIVIFVMLMSTFDKASIFTFFKLRNFLPCENLKLIVIVSADIIINKIMLITFRLSCKNLRHSLQKTLYKVLTVTTLSNCPSHHDLHDS